MNNQTFIVASIILCSLGGWYVVVTKYLALKKMVKDQDNEFPPHIPGMGPPPVDFFNHEQYSLPQQPAFTAPPVQASVPAPAIPSIFASVTTEQKREICNTACMLHLTGFAIIFGMPFLNVLLPTLFWLWKKEHHQFIDKQGREVINFQITFTLIQFLCLGVGVLFIRYLPAHAEKIFAFIKISRIVFSSGMYVPFNVFTMIPFFWACVVMIRGAVAAYHGVSYNYPVAQQFVFAAPMSQVQPQAKPQQQPAAPKFPNKVSFS